MWTWSKIDDSNMKPQYEHENHELMIPLLAIFVSPFCLIKLIFFLITIFYSVFSHFLMILKIAVWWKFSFFLIESGNGKILTTKNSIEFQIFEKMLKKTCYFGNFSKFQCLFFDLFCLTNIIQSKIGKIDRTLRNDRMAKTFCLKKIRTCFQLFLCSKL